MRPAGSSALIFCGWVLCVAIVLGGLSYSGGVHAEKTGGAAFNGRHSASNERRGPAGSTSRSRETTESPNTPQLSSAAAPPHHHKHHRHGHHQHHPHEQTHVIDPREQPEVVVNPVKEKKFKPHLVGAFFSPVTAKANALAARIDEPTLPLFKRVLRFLKLREPLAQLLFAFGVSSDIHFLRAVCGFIAFLFWVTLITTILGTSGVDIRPFVTTLGLSGFIIGFALKEVATNLLSGVLLVVQRPIRVGWVIKVAGQIGQVTGIDSRYVILQNEDGHYILIPSYK